MTAGTDRRLAFAVDGLAADARAAVGAPPETPLRHLDALARLAAALDTEARLSAAGRPAVRAALVGALATQLRVAAAHREHPEIGRIPVAAPVFVIGLLRTGSTLVHNLLAQHPALRVPALWELMHPVSDDHTEAGFARLADATQTYVTEYYRVAPRLPAVHFLDARRPDECHRLTGNTFQTMVYEARYRVPSYSRWLAGADLTASYAEHRAQLQAILWRIPGGTVVCKDPFHLWSLPALAAAYPDARYIHLHRDPTEAVPSTCSLCVAIRMARSDRLDLPEIGRHWLAQIERAVRLAAAARRGPLAGRPVLDVRYRDLVRDPLGVLGTVCDFLGVPLTAAAERRMRAYLAENSQRKHGEHRYTAAEFGLSTADLDSRFTEYRDTYHV